MVALRAYMAVVDKYASQNPQLAFDPIYGPMFVNKKLEKYKSEKKTLNTSFISDLGNAGHLTPYDFRRMFSTYVGSSKSNLLRQYGAIAASHRLKIILLNTK